MSIAQTSPSQTSDFRSVIERANRTIRMTRVMLGILTWFAITATIWLGLFALDNLLDLPSALADDEAFERFARPQSTPFWSLGVDDRWMTVT